MSTETQLHGGRLVARSLRAWGVTKLFTLSGGHLFSIYDGCREEGIDIVDVRHEQNAAFAAEGWAKATRQPGGGARAMRWGVGSPQEIDHVPFVAPLVKSARTADSPAAIPGLVDEALRLTL